MKTLTVLFVVVLSAIFLSCHDQGTSTETSVTPEQIHRAYSPPGQLVAIFVDTVSRTEAELFVRGLELTPMNFAHFDDDTNHWGIIGVPIGREMFWVDSLRTYKSFVKEVFWPAVVEAQEVPHPDVSGAGLLGAAY